MGCYHFIYFLKISTIRVYNTFKTENIQLGNMNHDLIISIILQNSTLKIAIIDALYQKGGPREIFLCYTESFVAIIYENVSIF